MRWAVLRGAVNNTLALVDPDMVDIVVAVVLSTPIYGEPVWVFVSGPSGSGKGELFRLIETCGHVEIVDTFSPKALISGSKETDDDGNVSYGKSLLKRCDGKTLLIAESSPWLCMRKEEFQESYGLFRQSFDGRVSKPFGNRVVAFETHFSFLAATTQQIELQIGQEDRAFGERFLTYKPTFREHNAHTDHALRMAASAYEWRKRLSDQIADYIQEKIDQVPKTLADITTEIEDLAPMAQFAATARTPVVRNKFRRDAVEIPPEVEYGTRLAKQLYKLGKVVAWNGGNHQRVVKRLALSSIPIVRQSILQHIHRTSFATTTQLSNSIRADDQYILMEADNLTFVGILNRSATSKITNQFGTFNVYTYSISPTYAPGLELMMGPKWMGDSHEEVEEARQRVEQTVRRHENAERPPVIDNDDFELSAEQSDEDEFVPASNGNDDDEGDDWS